MRNSFIQGAVVTIPDLPEVIEKTPETIPIQPAAITVTSGPAPPPPPMKKPTTTNATTNKFGPSKFRKIILTHEPWQFEVPNTIGLEEAKIKLRFMGHYSEPVIQFGLNLDITEIHLTYHPDHLSWQVVYPTNFKIELIS